MYGAPPCPILRNKDYKVCSKIYSGKPSALNLVRLLGLIIIIMRGYVIM